MTPSPIRLEGDRLHIGERVAISFQRTLRLPDDGREYPLPPGLGRFQIRRAADYADLPVSWRNDFLIPMYLREALWLGFDAVEWKPNAVKVGVGGIDAVSGEVWNDVLETNPQNYLVIPDQPWLDGINSGGGTVRQFVAMPLGLGVTVEAELTGAEQTGGIQLAVYEPVPGRFPDTAPPSPSPPHTPIALAEPQAMGLGAGGVMRQKIYPDPYGIRSWDLASVTPVFVRLLSVSAYCAITGEPAPDSPADAAAYTQAGLPWFDLDDQNESAVAAAEALARVRSIRELEGRQLEAGVDVARIRRLRRRDI